jgi:(1->4)-alpha-D-glucan 1-alpha-D-glucosylmutase
MGDNWLDLVGWWRDLCSRHADEAAGGPDDDEQLFVLQTLVGAWPISRARLDGYLTKAFREAKRHTSWVDPDEAWEQRVFDLFAQVMAAHEFTERFTSFVVDVVHRADRIALGELVLRCLSPGVPDVYQGDELWNHLLVDPDNRRPVDWSLRRLLLDHQLRGANLDRYTAKLFATRTLLGVRRRFLGFAQHDYLPLDAPADVCAFARGSLDAPDVVAVVPVRPSRELRRPALVRDEHEWIDVLAPLDAIYGDRRPGAFVRAR